MSVPNNIIIIGIASNGPISSQNVADVAAVPAICPVFQTDHLVMSYGPNYDGVPVPFHAISLKTDS